MAAVDPYDGALTRVLDAIAARPGCRLRPSAGPPQVSAGLVVPEDLRRLYLHCGGAVLFADAAFGWRISGPDELVAASPRLLTPEIADDIAVTDPSDLTTGCYVIADAGSGGSTEPHIVIDLHPARAGRYYAAAWDTYGLVGEMPVVATSITELLHRLLDTSGEQAFPPGPYHGDAYDEHLHG